MVIVYYLTARPNYKQLYYFLRQKNITSIFFICKKCITLGTAKRRKGPRPLFINLTAQIDYLFRYDLYLARRHLRPRRA